MMTLLFQVLVFCIVMSEFAVLTETSSTDTSHFDCYVFEPAFLSVDFLQRNSLRGIESLFHVHQNDS